MGKNEILPEKIDANKIESREGEEAHKD